MSKHVYWPRKTRFEERYTVKIQLSERFSIDVWAYISFQGIFKEWMDGSSITVLPWPANSSTGLNPIENVWSC